MKQVKFAFIILVISLLIPYNVYCRRDDPFLTYQHRGLIGVNFGGSMPIPIPNYITPTAWSPKFSPVLGYELTLMSNYGIGATIGLRFEMKGMNADANVYQIYTKVSTDEVQANGYFTGKNHTEVNNKYLIMPIGLAWQPKNEKWLVNLNFYLATLLGGSFKGNVSDGYLREDNPTGNRIDITSAQEFDFSNQLRSFDYGLEAGFYRTIYKKLQCNVHISWGLSPITVKEFNGMPFKMKNIFGRIGFSYRFQ